MIARDVSGNGELSHKARGLMAFLLSLPDDWVLHMNELYTHFKRDGRESTDSAVRELRQDGYITRVQERVEGGTYGTVTYFIHEVPVETPDVLETRKSTPRKPTVNGFPVSGEKEDKSTVNGFSANGKPATTNNNTEGIISPTVSSFPTGFNSVNTIKSISQSVGQSADKKDRLTDELKDIEDLKNIQAVLDDEYLKDPNVVSAVFLESLRGYIRDLFFIDELKVGGSTIPQALVRETLRELTPYCIEHTYKKIDEYSREKGIISPKAYTQVILYNSVSDETVSMLTELNYKVHGNGRKRN